MNETNLLSKKDAISYLNINDKEFKNYHENSHEIKGQKISGKWYFPILELKNFKETRERRTILLSMPEYERCFEFAIKMVYGGLALNGIRGQRTEVQASDDVILGILAELAIKKFLNEKFGLKIELDESVHPGKITPQDIHKIIENNTLRDPKIGIGIKASKTKSGYLVLVPNEVEHQDRKSDAYIFARVGLPSDHLFRILRDHSFFAKVRKFLEENTGFKKINVLNDVPVWICGFCYEYELEKVNDIPGQKFDGYRYVKSVDKLHNSDEDWNRLISKL